MSSDVITRYILKEAKHSPKDLYGHTTNSIFVAKTFRQT